MSEMLYNPYELIIIQENVIPQEHIEEIMLLTNNTKDISHATIINKVQEKETGDSHEEDLKVRNTLWYSITDEVAKNFEQAVAQCFKNFVIPKYHCEFKSYEPVQFLGYPPGGHYKGHNDGESFNIETRQWESCMPRDVSFLFYLNDQYGGGELEFYDLGLTIKPKKGMMIAFPSYKDFAHKVHPVTWGHRYSLVSWVETQKNLYDTIPRPGIPKS
jgi:predicted 2-oxoglutarate/Fe(II)-dependent dioxygenase YbiX